MKSSPRRERSPRREPLDAVVGMIAGVLWGGFSVLGIGLLMFPGNLPILVAAIGLSSLVFGVLGYFKGDDFFRWVRDQSW